MQSFAFLFALISLFFASAVGAPRVLEPSRGTSCLTCVGCLATKNEDPISNTFGGIRTTLPIDPVLMNFSAKLTPTPGACTLVQSGDAYVCGPTGNCSFNGTYSYTHPTGFHDSSIPCNWAVQAGGGGPYTITGSIDWIAACSGQVTWRPLYFYDRSTTCANGQLIGLLEFSGVCSTCPPGGGGDPH